MQVTKLPMWLSAILLISAAAHGGTPKSGTMVFAAASLTNAMQDISKAWTAAGHGPVVFSFASSSTLAQQIEHGAPANIFASADEKSMDDAAAHGDIAADTCAYVLGGSLVLVEPAATAKPVTIAPGFDLPAILGPDGRLAVGDPAHVPAGIYAKQALQRLGVWDKVSARLAPADSVRSAMLLIERGEVPAGIVYETDAAVSHSLRVVGTFPESSHDPITYPFAVTKAGDTPEARAFLTYVRGPAAKAIFTKYGFATH